MIKKWLPFNHEVSVSKRKLFCFPHSGAGASVFYKWLKFSTPEIEVCPIQLPGRESRYSEKPYTNMLSLISSLKDVLKQTIGKNAVFFGHSLGGYIAFECAKQFQDEKVSVIVSATPSPNKKKQNHLRELPDHQFLEHIISYGGISKELIDQKELLQLIIPTLRADIDILETYIPMPPSRLQGKLIAFGGSQDSLVSEMDLLDWKNFTSGHFLYDFFYGDHFYYQLSAQEVFNKILSLV